MCSSVGTLEQTAHACSLVLFSIILRICAGTGSPLVPCRRLYIVEFLIPLAITILLVICLCQAAPPRPHRVSRPKPDRPARQQIMPVDAPASGEDGSDNPAVEQREENRAGAEGDEQ